MEAREALQDRISTLRQQRGAAVLDKRGFDSKALVQAEADLAALDDAQDVRVARAREGSEAERQKRLAEARTEFRTGEANFLSHIRKAQEHALATRDAINAALEANKGQGRLAHEISGERGVPIVFNVREVENILACLLSADMSRINYPKTRLGPILWPVSHYKPGLDWGEVFAKKRAAETEKLVGKD